MIVNAGSAGYIFDGDPTASWALVEVDGERGHRRDPAHRVRRDDGRERDQRPRPAGRRLSRGHRANREAGPMSAGWPSEPRRVVVTGMGMRHGARQRRRVDAGTGLVAGRSGIRTIESFDPSRLDSRIAGEVHDFDSSAHPRPQGGPPDGPLHPVRARGVAPGDGPGRPAGAARRRRWPSGPASSSGPASAASGRS